MGKDKRIRKWQVVMDMDGKIVGANASHLTTEAIRHKFVPNMRVRIFGLRNFADLNGTEGTIIERLPDD